jgi:hypothetical protein
MTSDLTLELETLKSSTRMIISDKARQLESETRQVAMLNREIVVLEDRLNVKNETMLQLEKKVEDMHRQLLQERDCAYLIRAEAAKAQEVTKGTVQTYAKILSTEVATTAELAENKPRQQSQIKTEEVLLLGASQTRDI